MDVIFYFHLTGWGIRGFDIWATSLDSNLEPIQVRNLGNVINSAGDEEAPYLHDKTRTLVFSSKGGWVWAALIFIMPKEVLV